MTVQQLKDDLAALVAKEQAAEAKEAADLQSISNAIQALRDRLNNGEMISQQDLDDLSAKVQSVSAGLDTIVSGLDAAAAADVAE